MARKTTPTKGPKGPRKGTGPGARAKKKGGETDEMRTAVAPPAKMTSANKLNNLIKLGRRVTQEGRALAGEMGSAIKTAAENDNLHKKAFAVARGLDRLEPEALADFFAHFDYYCDAVGLRKRAGSVMRMDFEEGNTEGSDAESPHQAASDEEAGRRAGNVRDFPPPRAAAAE